MNSNNRLFQFSVFLLSIFTIATIARETYDIKLIDSGKLDLLTHSFLQGKFPINISHNNTLLQIQFSFNINYPILIFCLKATMNYFKFLNI